MHSIRILRLTGDRREEYIRNSLGELTPRELRKIVKSYGLIEKGMKKNEMIEALTSALLRWAEITELQLNELGEQNG